MRTEQCEWYRDGDYERCKQHGSMRRRDFPERGRYLCAEELRLKTNGKPHWFKYKFWICIDTTGRKTFYNENNFPP